MKPLAECRLYAFVDTAYLLGRDPAEIARQLCDGGADLIQFRAKDWPAEDLERTAEALLPICDSNGVWLVINDHPDIAARIGAPLAHLGQEDLLNYQDTNLADISADLSPLRPPSLPPLDIGMSTHAPEDAFRSMAAGAAYLAIGPVFPTPTKPGRPAVTLEYVRWAAQHVNHFPWFAIGGITQANLLEILESGAKRVCIVSAILKAPHIATACRAFRDRLP